MWVETAEFGINRFPIQMQGCPGKIHYDAGCMPGVAGKAGYFLVVETQKGPGMRYSA